MTAGPTNSASHSCHNSSTSNQICAHVKSIYRQCDQGLYRQLTQCQTTSTLKSQAIQLLQKVTTQLATLNASSDACKQLLSAYLIDLCCPSLTARSTRHLRSAEQGLLHVPFAHTSTMQNRAFSVVGPLVWNGLPLALRSLPRVFSQKFLQQLKITLFGHAGVRSASE